MTSIYDQPIEQQRIFSLMKYKWAEKNLLLPVYCPFILLLDDFDVKLPLGELVFLQIKHNNLAKRKSLNNIVAFRGQCRKLINLVKEQMKDVKQSDVIAVVNITKERRKKNG